MIIYVDTAFGKKNKDRLCAAVGPGFSVVFRDELDNEQEQLSALLKADVLLGNPRPASMLAQAVNLKWVQLYTTGFEYYEGIHIPAVVTNMQDYYSQPTAETAVAGIMALYRGINTLARLKEHGEWIGYPIRYGLQTLRNKQVIILGPGNIGRCIAKILAGFNCSIQFYGRTSAMATLKTVEALQAALPQADIVVACLPGTEQTKGMFTKEMLMAMKPSAVFCNVGRGNLVADENDLAEALSMNKIGGAVLDVTIQEPIPPDHLFWQCPNLVLTQHSGGGSVTEYDGIMDFFLQNLALFTAGKPLQNQVSFTRGY